MPIFHPCDDAQLAAGRLMLRIEGPPFAERSVDVGMFLVDCIEECVTLMTALEARAVETGVLGRRTSTRERQ